MYKEIVIKNTNDEELKENIEQLLSQMKSEFSESLCVIKFLIKKNKFEYANDVLTSIFSEVIIGDTYEEILNLLKRLNNETK